MKQGLGTIRVMVNDQDMTPSLLPRGGHMAAAHTWHYMASSTFRLQPGKHTVVIERVNPRGGTAFIDEVHLSSELAFYGGPDAPNFPAGGHAIGQHESDHGAYYRLDCAPALDDARLSALAGPYMPAVVIRTPRNAAGLPEDLPPHTIVEYEAERDRRAEFFEVRKGLPKEARVALARGSQP